MDTRPPLFYRAVRATFAVQVAGAWVVTAWVFLGTSSVEPRQVVSLPAACNFFSPVSAGGELLVTCDMVPGAKEPRGDVVRVWDLATREEILALKGLDADVEAIASSPDGRAFATASPDNTLRVWDLTT